MEFPNEEYCMMQSAIPEFAHHETEGMAPCLNMMKYQDYIFSDVKICLKMSDCKKLLPALKVCIKSLDLVAFATIVITYSEPG